MSTVDAWFDAATDEQRPLLASLRRIVLDTAPDLVEEIKWNQPCYKHARHVCYINRNKSHVVLGFQRGAHLDDPKGLLEGTGKDMRHVKVRSDADVRTSAFRDLVRQAIALDEASS